MDTYTFCFEEDKQPYDTWIDKDYCYYHVGVNDSDTPNKRCKK
jgi:hypothetical protein